MGTLIFIVIGGIVVFIVVLLYLLTKYCGLCSSASQQTTDRDEGFTSIHLENDVLDGSLQPFVVKSKISETEAQNIFENIQQIQNSLRTCEEQRIHEVQRLLLLAKSRDNDKATGSLIIGVDATPVTLAGYCVNVRNKTLQFYVMKRDNFPWILHDPNNTAEFEMKNFNFALTLWQKEIIKHKQISIYTDNFAVVNAKEKYGARAAQLMDHYVHCCKIVITNQGGVAINKYKNVKHFAKYIQPVDDLSRWKINQGLDFLCKLHGIESENVRGTHYHKISIRKRPTAPGSTPSKPWYEPTDYYQQVLAEVNNHITSHNCKNPNCPFDKNHLRSSLKRNP